MYVCICMYVCMYVRSSRLGPLAGHSSRGGGGGSTKSKGGGGKYEDGHKSKYR